MKNLIVSIEKLPRPVMQALNSMYPYGYDHKVFEFEHPAKNEVYTAIRFSIGDMNYVIKLEKREKNIDRWFDTD